MSVDDLRAGLARIAGTVVPDPDPYALVMRYARRRRRRRFAGLVAAVAAVLAAALAGPAALNTGGLHHRPDDRLGHGYPVGSPWGWRLIDSPVRGSLAGDTAFVAEVTRLFDRGREEVLMSADLPTVKVLFADESAGFRQVVLAYHSATSAALVSRQGSVGASPARLLHGDGASNVRPDQFVLFFATSGTPGAQRQWLLGLAPAGCRLSLGRAAYAGQSGLRRQWQAQPTDGYVLVDQAASDGWWRVECDGQVRQEGPMWFAEPDRAGNVDETYPDDGRWVPTAEAPNPTVARQAGQMYRALARQSGLVDVARPVIRWSGRLDALGGEAALLTAPGGGPTLLQVGDSGAGPLLARATLRDPAPAGPAPARGPLPPPLVATGYAPAPDLLAVRVPARDGDRAVLTDQLLVVPAKGVTRIEAVADGQSRAGARTTGGAALLTLPIGTQVTLRALDADGKVVASGVLREPAAGERIFNEPLTSAW